MTKAECFNAEITDNCQFLVLGSMPGVISLEQQAYYAHPRNAFWPIMADIFKFEPDLAYNERVNMLNQAGVGLWDVIASCHRQGSLDSAIKNHDLEVNQFEACFKQYPNIDCLLFNGQKAATLYKQKVLPRLSESAAQLKQFVMPSTSPAHASIRFEQKLAAWKQAFCN